MRRAVARGRAALHAAAQRHDATTTVKKVFQLDFQVIIFRLTALELMIASG